MQWRSGTDLHHRVHVTGTITYYRPGESLVIEDHGSALYARTDQSRALSLGDRVDLLGFPAPRDSGPILENAILRRVASGAPLTPTSVKIANLCSGDLNYNLISTDGILVQQLHGPSQRTLLLRDGANFMEAELDSGAEPKLRALHDGSTVRIRGINALRVSRAWNYDGDGAEKVHCKILMRTEDDATLVQLPTWWTVPHAVYVAIALAALALLFLIQIIRSLFDRWRLQAVLAERERIAHDLHDTLAQSFAGIGFQLQAIRRQIPGDLHNLSQHVDLARDLILHSHREARRTLASYSAETSERFDLLERLEKSAHTMAEGGSVDITTSLAGDLRPLRPAVATALLRIGQEAIANAIRHAGPTHLGIALFYGENRVALAVTDDGNGFVERGDLLGFGLRGMRKRAAAVAATFELSSVPGNGTRISVIVPGSSAFGSSGIRHALRHYLRSPSSMQIQKNSPIRILIVDDHPVVCAGLASMLAGHEQFEVVGSVASGERALAVIRQSAPAVLLLDLRMPGMDGIAVLHALKSMTSPPRALILTSFEKDEDIYRAIRSGAAGYLLKDTTEAEMVTAITQVNGGRPYIPRHIAARLAARRMRSDLTGREHQILELVANGSTNKEIGKTLSISENTVRHHVVSIMEKLQVSDRTEAVSIAIRQGILPEGG